MKKTKDEKSSLAYELCKVCKINHNQGKRHNYFPRHKTSLSTLFSKFLVKISDVKLSLKNPTLKNPNSSLVPIWCIFCDAEVNEGGAMFSRGNMIEHLASEGHFRNLKQFLWKYGGGGGGSGDKVESFRINEAEFSKWKKKCLVLEREAASTSKSNDGPLNGQSNDIQPIPEILNSFETYNIQFPDSSCSNDVIPLRYSTNEKYQVHHSDISKAGKVTPFSQNTAALMPLVSQNGWNTSNAAYMNYNNQSSLLPAGTNFSPSGSVSAVVHLNQSNTRKEPMTEGYQKLTQIVYGASEDVKGNVHSGALPPWLEGIEVEKDNVQKRDLWIKSSPKNSKKNSQLNPKRVGAAWAERRKMELEMEKKGEVIASVSDADWLPNFGRVWQSGSRKDSMKEFKKEKLDLPIPETLAASEITIRPYVSKRMRRDTNVIHSDDAE